MYNSLVMEKLIIMNRKLLHFIEFIIGFLIYYLNNIKITSFIITLIIFIIIELIFGYLKNKKGN